MTMGKREITVLSGITIVGFLLRLVVVFFMGSDPLVYDSKMYLLVADGMVNEAPISSFPNGYPLVIAMFRSFLPTAQTIQALLVLNVLLSAACIPLTYVFCKLCRLQNWVPSVAAALVAVYPHQLRYAQLVMTETIATTVLLVAMCGTLLIWVRKTERLSVLIPVCLLTGFLFHVTGAIRPSLLLIGVLIPVAFALISRSVKLPLLMVSGFMIGAGLLYGIEKSPLARPPHAFGNNLLISINSDSNGTEFVAFPEDQQKKAVKTYIEFAAKNPSRFLRQRAISLWELWGPKSLAGYRQEQETAVVKGIVVLRTLFLLVFLVGVVLFRKQPEVHFAAIPIAVVTIIHMLTFSNHRFLVPIEPFLFTISLAGGGVCLKKVVDLSKRGRLSTSKSVGAH